MINEKHSSSTFCNCNRSQNSSTSTEFNKKSVEKNAKNEFNYYGKYVGILPCADCEGIETEIKLRKDNTFIKKTKYLGKSNVTTTEVTGRIFGLIECKAWLNIMLFVLTDCLSEIFSTYKT